MHKSTFKSYIVYFLNLLTWVPDVMLSIPIYQVKEYSLGENDIQNNTASNIPRVFFFLSPVSHNAMNASFFFSTGGIM